MSATDPRTAATAAIGLVVTLGTPLALLVGPTPEVKLVAVLLFAAAGLGSAVMCWIDTGDAWSQAGLVVVFSLAAFAAAATVLIWLAFWHTWLIVALGAPAALSCAGRIRAQRPGVRR